MSNFDLSQISINNDTTLLDTLKWMDNCRCKSLLVFNEGRKFETLITIGDIQREILKGSDLSSRISEAEIDQKIFATSDHSKKDIKEMMLDIRCEIMPVVDEYGELLEVIFWKDLFEANDDMECKSVLNLPVVIMAGGKGTRLKPISHVIPKPLIPVGEKTIIEEIMSRFHRYGCHRYYLSVNYKKDMIKYYLGQLENDSLEISYFEEEKPLGTAGSLNLLRGEIDTSFFVSNCDILIDQDLNDIYEYHQNNRNEITVVGSLKTFPISYGTLQTTTDGLLQSMQEKPEVTYMINTGVYILEPHLLEIIKPDEFLHITDLIDQVRQRGGRVGVFPISEKSWMDIGEWKEYRETVHQLSSDSNNFRGL